MDALRTNLEEHDPVVLGAALEPRLEVLLPEVALARVVLDDLGLPFDGHPRSLIGRDVGKLDSRVGLDFGDLAAVAIAEEPVVAVELDLTVVRHRATTDGAV